MSLRIRSRADLPEALRRQVDSVLAQSNANAPDLKPSKYRNVRCEIDGHRFDSKLEARCYDWLKGLQHAGDLRWFVRQVSFELPGGVRYRADFLAVLANGSVQVIDAKGYDTQASRNKRRQVQALYGVTLQLWPIRALPALAQQASHSGA